MNECVYRQNQEVIFRQEQDEALLFNPATSAIAAINSTACYAWGLFDGKLTLGAIINKMTERFEVEQVILKKDLMSCIKDLEKEGFLEKIK